MGFHCCDAPQFRSPHFSAVHPELEGSRFVMGMLRANVECADALEIARWPSLQARGSAQGYLLSDPRRGSVLWLATLIAEAHSPRLSLHANASEISLLYSQAASESHLTSGRLHLTLRDATDVGFDLPPAIGKGPAGILSPGVATWSAEWDRELERTPWRRLALELTWAGARRDRVEVTVGSSAGPCRQTGLEAVFEATMPLDVFLPNQFRMAVREIFGDSPWTSTEACW